VDDARFEAAMAGAALGDREQAEVDLRSLAEMASRPTTLRKQGSLLDTPDRRTVLRAGLARYRQLPIREEQVIGMIDQDGPSLARGALRRLDASVVIARVATPQSRRLEPMVADSTHDVRDVAPTRRPIADAPPAARTRWPWLLAAIVTVLVVAMRELARAFGVIRRRASRRA
jgi:hypothetical protein